ncbi:MAG: DNA sulfur modification protein DndD [Aestuariivita sp.]|nr:DNA sulfur modification protein DndD [Aestuariivita sp.]MCY4346910.1 DNA sulfur modification protein DndD [Aestuariivita sp.]
MILNSVRIFNFGLYCGEHHFDLTPYSEDHRPLVLIVGHNGAGKTTFLESVRLALYGKRALGPRIGQAEYEQHLIKYINNFAAERQASVELAFKSRFLGSEDSYLVRRTWKADSTEFVENLKFERNGKSVDDIPKEDWNHYLEEIVPVGVSQFFFFDGEKIQDIADSQQNARLTEAIKSLLGIDILDQLRSDLALYKSRSVDRNMEIDLEAIRGDLNDARSNMAAMEVEIESLSSKRSEFAMRSEASQKTFRKEGGDIALSRDTLSDELRRVEIELSKQINALKSLVNGMAPFALAPKLLAKFSVDVEQSRGYQSGPAIEHFVSDFEKAIVTHMAGEWTNAHFTDLRDFARRRRKSFSKKILSAEPEWVLEKLSQVTDARLAVANLAEPLATLQRQRLALKEKLKNFQPGAAIAAFEKLKKAEFELGKIEAELNQKEVELNRLHTLIDRLERELRKSEDAVFASTRSEARRDLASRTQAALKDYEERIINLRLSSLSKHFTEAFSSLVSRKSLVRKITLEPSSFQLKLLGEIGKEIMPSELSAGERQLFAISMLLALGKTSGRELPMIVDTPLSRLDQQHRINLVSNYVSRKNGQIVMLCTDTELTKDLLETIVPYVSRRFEIRTVLEGKYTEVKVVDANSNGKVLPMSHAH